ncbi:MAG TPA: prepilin-type N-terminal cleavage/methylation domain-containing protein [Bryobacteraceae bacterium]|nr:prepilin-type N-terminal cleavage/methylation domain-containing protein [Bryobacteraceae bacterium]
MRWREAGITLIEMLVVVSIIAVAAAIAYPSVNSGVDSLRLTSAADSIVSFLNGALVRADRRQELAEVTISRAERALILRAQDPSYVRRMELPEGITIVRVHPAQLAGNEEQDRSFIFYPGGSVPRIAIEIQNRRGARRLVQVDPITGSPRVSVPEQRP